MITDLNLIEIKEILPQYAEYLLVVLVLHDINKIESSTEEWVNWVGSLKLCNHWSASIVLGVTPLFLRGPQIEVIKCSTSDVLLKWTLY